MTNQKEIKLDSNQPLVKEDRLSSLKKKQKSGSSKFFNLRTKATLLAIAIGVIPVATVGVLAYSVLERSLTKEIGEEQIGKTAIAANDVTRFLESRVNEIDALAQDSLLVDAKFRDKATQREKIAVLNNFKNKLEFYNSVIFYNLKGEQEFKAVSYNLGKENLAKSDYFQEAIKSQKITINDPGLSKDSGQLRIEFAAPVKDVDTGKLIGVLKVVIPGNYIKDLFEVYQQQDQHWNLVNAEGTVFAGDRANNLNQSIANLFPALTRLHQAKEKGMVRVNVNNANSSNSSETVNQQVDKVDKNGKQISQNDGKQLVTYVAAPAPEKFPDLHIGTILTKSENIALAPIKNLAWTIFLGTVIAALLVAAIAAYLASRATVPIIDAVKAVQKIGEGKLDTRLTINSNDELGELSSNINLMTEQIQTSLQEQKELAALQLLEKEKLELAIYTLLDEVSDATEGDLTVRANLDSMELSTVADLFNAIIGNLQDIAIEAKQSTSQMGFSLKQNESAIRLLAEQAIAEARETRDTLTSIKQMSLSIQAVSTNARQAEQIADDTYNTVVSSTGNMDLTVNSILELRTTVGETAKKMKRLGESSQKISQAVSFIEEIALKTNVLAINASVEAGRAGEFGQGFTIVAEQVGALAEQSAAATKEIASIVAAIQAETQEVNQAMELGTIQVVETTRLVETTKQSLGQALEKSLTINQLMESISQSTVSQAATSENVINLMQKIASLSEATSQSSSQVVQSIMEAAKVAEKLEFAVAQFKVAESS